MRERSPWSRGPGAAMVYGGPLAAATKWLTGALARGCSGGWGLIANARK
jgi:hypothetical protein